MSETNPRRDIGTKKLTRRRIVGIGAAAAGAGVTIAILGSEVPRSTSVKFENFQLKQHTLRIVMSEHDESVWAQNQVQIEQEVANADIVIPEYYPREYEHLKNTRNPLYYPVTTYSQRNDLFEHITALCIQNNKPMWVIEPEHNEEGGLLRYELLAPPLLLPLAGILVGSSKTAKKYYEKQISRREMLERLGVVLGLGTGVLVSGIDFAIDLEDDLRHVVSAELLDQVDNAQDSSPNANSQKKITMFIPKPHWQGIKAYYSDPEARKERLELYMQLFGSQFPTLFEARYHEAGDASGNPTHKIELLT